MVRWERDVCASSIGNRCASWMWALNDREKAGRAGGVAGSDVTWKLVHSKVSRELLLINN